ncbi:MAG: hypothetical protein JXJ04_23680 [Spirochaetales bacterium]|nr:hypothetical protein [Spirochaetales bacterium]
MQRLAVFFLIIGVGSFILPGMGLQFKLISLFGENSVIVSVICIIVGVVLFFIGRKSGEDAPTSAAEIEETRNLESKYHCPSCGVSITSMDRVCPKCKKPIPDAAI